jgi:hypothetical protein
MGVKKMSDVINNKYLEIGAEISFEMDKILRAKLQGKSSEYKFKVGSYALSSLIASFVDDIFSNKFPDKKIEFIGELIISSKLLLHVKNKIRESNKGDPH